MYKSIIVFTEDDILSMLKNYSLLNDSFFVEATENRFSSCYHLAKKLNADVIIIQIQLESDIGDCLEFMRLLDEDLDFSPTILIFQKTAPDHILFTTSDQSLAQWAREFAEWFICAVAPKYKASFSYFHETALEDSAEYNDKHFADQHFYEMKREAALQEIMRGCTSKEIKAYRKTYQLDLRKNGYYLFIWELQNVEYNKHFFNKDAYNLMGKNLEEKFLNIIREYDGGELIRMNLNKICLIINSPNHKSEAKRFEKNNELFVRLSKCANIQSSVTYISDYIDHLENLRIARDFYEENKAAIFFLRSDGILTERNIRRRLEIFNFNVETATPLVTSVCEYIKYDINNPRLLKTLHQLFFEVLKPSMSFSIYYYSMAAIGSELLKRNSKFVPFFSKERFSREHLRFSSIEEQYDLLVDEIEEVQKEIGWQNKSNNYFVMGTIEFIKENYPREITVPEIAEKLHISHMYLSQIFKKEMGISVINFIVNYRIEQAKKMILDTRIPIYEIAEHVGFNDLTHFSKTFKSKVGLSPMQYRKNKE